MKFLKFLAPIMLAAVLGATAQQVIGPAGGTVFSTNMTLVTTATSNFFNIPQTRNIPVGAAGVGLAVTLWSPVALSTTNCQMLFQATVDGTNWIASPAGIASINFNNIAPNATTLNTTYTNFLTAGAFNLGNIRYIRPQWFTNQNGTNWIYISNIVWSAR